MTLHLKTIINNLGSFRRVGKPAGSVWEPPPPDNEYEWIQDCTMYFRDIFIFFRSTLDMYVHVQSSKIHVKYMYLHVQVKYTSIFLLITNTFFYMWSDWLGNSRNEDH